MDRDPADLYAPAPEGTLDIDDLLPPYVPPAAPPRRRPRRLVALAVGIVALLATGAFAVVSITGGDGAGSPEDAVHDLLDAGSHEDLIGVLEALPPGERSAILDPVKDIAGELKRLGILDDGLDLSKVGGLDLEFRDVALTSRPLADGIAEVTITAGTATARSIPEDLPIGPELDRILKGWGASTDVDATTSTENMAGTRLVVIEEGGGWHVSLFYSIAESGRRDSESPLPDFGHGVPAVGAASPEAAVEEAVRAATRLDVRRLIELTPPDEMRALHDYAPLFLDDVERGKADLLDNGFKVEIDDLVTEAKGSGDTRHVAVKKLTLHAGDEDGSLSFSWDGRCVSFSVTDEEARHECTDDPTSSLHDVKVPDDMGITVVQRDGAWYVSPTRTLLDLLVSALRAVDKGTLDKIADPEGLLSSMFGTSDSVESSSGSGFSTGGTLHVCQNTCTYGGDTPLGTATTVVTDPAIAHIEDCKAQADQPGLSPDEQQSTLQRCLVGD